MYYSDSMNIDSVYKTIETIKTDIQTVSSHEDLELFRLKYLVRKGIVQQLFEGLKTASPEDRPLLGKALNELRQTAQKLFEEKKEELESSQSVSHVGIDLTIPGRRRPIGTKHPVTQALDDMTNIFKSMGFAVALGPEIEDDFHNFEALNFPPDHPARDMQDTFFLGSEGLLRTHTSPVQIRVMMNQEPPIRHVMPGRVYRNEAISARSYCMFHQLEGLAVDENITFAELKGTLATFAKKFFGSSVRYVFRPSFFPFTEPSAEMDISCFLCNGKGCRVCKQSGWLEILGCGMVDPNVFKAVGYDPEKVTGYAFGMGIDRTALLLYGIDDIRLLYENDIRLLNQFV
jgi:phenylalanyl-tRNA synthetase alpha chain